MLEATNYRRQVLQLEPLGNLGTDTSLKVGMGGSGDSPSAKVTIPKKQAQKDVTALAQMLAEDEPEGLRKAREAVAAMLRQLLDSPELLRSLKQEAFLRTGFELIDGDVCPFCDTPWEAAELQARISGKLETAKQATALKKSLEQAAAPLIAALEGLRSLAVTTAGYLRQLAAPTSGAMPQDSSGTALLTQWAADLKADTRRRQRG